MFDFKPFLEMFETVATKFGAKLAFALIVSFLIVAYPFMEVPTETVALAKIAGVTIVGVVFLVFRYKEGKNKNGGTK